MSKRRPITVRRNPTRLPRTTSQRTLNRRIREIFSDGYGLLPHNASYPQIEMMRRALKELASDGAFWNGLKKLQAIKQEAADLVESLKSLRYRSLD